VAFRPRGQILWVDNHRVSEVPRTAWLNEVLRGNRRPLGDQESVGRDAQRRVMMEAAPPASFVVPKPDFLFDAMASSFKGRTELLN
jgi:hypothetical protein